MLKQRALSAIVFVPLVLVLAFLGGLPFELFWTAVLAFAGFEFVRMARGAGYQLSFYLTIGLIALIALLRLNYDMPVDNAILPAIVFLSAGYGLWQYENGEDKALWNAILHIFAAIYIGVLGSFAFSLNNSWLENNWWLVVTISLVWLVDAGAYLIGSRFGKTTVLPRLSHKKTLEGFLGGTVIGMLSGLLLGFFLEEMIPPLTPWTGALLGGIMGLAAFLGDAIMSLIKRTLGVKDAGKLLPGHGGILDRLDSMLWAFVISVSINMFLH